MNTQPQPDALEKLEVMPAESMADALDSSLAVGLSRAEIDQQIATARRYPRHLAKVAGNILSLVTLDEETAEECMYALPRGGKPIKGPSIRFAEIVKGAYGNCRSASRVVHVDRVEKVVIAEGVFHDLESNSATRSEVRRRIVDKRGKIYTDDMVIVTGNAASSIALRNAILGGIPKPIWRKAYDAVQHAIAGDIATLSETREKATKALATFGVTPAQIYVALGTEGPEEIKLEHIPILRGMFAALKNGEATVEEMFMGTVPTGVVRPKIAAVTPISPGEKREPPPMAKKAEEPAKEPDAPKTKPQPPPAKKAATEPVIEGNAGDLDDES